MMKTSSPKLDLFGERAEIIFYQKNDSTLLRKMQISGGFISGMETWRFLVLINMGFLSYKIR